MRAIRDGRWRMGCAEGSGERLKAKGSGDYVVSAVWEAREGKCGAKRDF